MRQPSIHLHHKSRKRRKTPEADLQKCIVEHLRIQGVPGLVVMKIANEGKRSPAMGLEMKRQGLLPGAPDLFILHNGTAHFLELKTKGAVPTHEQWVVAGRIELAKGYWDWADNIDGALAVLRSWNLLRSRERAA